MSSFLTFVASVVSSLRGVLLGGKTKDSGDELNFVLSNGVSAREGKVSIKLRKKKLLALKFHGNVTASPVSAGPGADQQEKKLRKKEKEFRTMESIDVCVFFVQVLDT